MRIFPILLNLNKIIVVIQNLKTITYVFELLPLIFCFLYLKKIRTKDLKVFLVYIIHYAILIIINIYIIYYYKSVSTFYFATRIFNITEYSLLAFFFSFHIKSIVFSNALKLSTVVYTFFCIIDFYKMTKPSIGFYPLTIECLVFLSTILFFFSEKMRDAESLEPLYETTIFWIATAFMFYFAGNFFLFLYSKNSYNTQGFRHNYTIIYSTVTIVKNILLCIGVSIKEKAANDNNRNAYLKKYLDKYKPFTDGSTL